MKPVDLSPDQRDVYEQMRVWCGGGDDKLLKVGGYAGTGKSTLLGVFASETKLRVAYISFTGRAASVLQRKLRACGVQTTSKLMPPEDMARRFKAGRSISAKAEAYYDFDLLQNDRTPFCGTIHRLLYRPIIDSETDELTGWTKRVTLDRSYDLIVVDEASMVGKEMLADLQAHGCPILAVGDHGQLPPVGDSGGLMESPDLRLEKIHRQAEGSPIIKLSEGIRKTGRLGRAEAPSVAYLRRDSTAAIEGIFNMARISGKLLDVGILCWTNKTRIRMNAYARRGAQFQGVPNEGEVVICLKNEPPVYNGMRGVLTTSGHLSGHHVNAYVAYPEEELAAAPTIMCAGQFNREKAFADVEELQARGIAVHSMRQAGSLYDFGYALTVHKSQGSQFQKAIVYVDRRVEPDSLDWRRWMYTAVTRASERLIILC